MTSATTLGTQTPGTGEPHFVLAAGGDRVAASGVRATFTDPRAAAAALRSGRAAAVVGALPFDPAAPCALTVPERFGPVATLGPVRELPTLVQVAEHPAPAEHVDRVRRAVELIRSGALRKVVLARAVDFEASAPVDPRALAAALERRDPGGNAFAVGLDAAGARYRGRTLVGASPELLVRREGDVVSCHPFAGTAAEPGGLLDSAKDREEHSYVVDEIAAALAPLCDGLEVPGAPSVSRAGPVWHLGTRIVGRLKDPATTALDLALVLHPTAAVCGFPRDAAARAIAELEGGDTDRAARGFYAGAVGWTNAAGDGHWRVGIRCAEIAPGGASLRAFAGGGIVGASDPAAELTETADKLRAVLGPFRIAQPVPSCERE